MGLAYIILKYSRPRVIRAKVLGKAAVGGRGAGGAVGIPRRCILYDGE